MNKQMVESKESRTVKYIQRATLRLIKLLLILFLLFLVVAGIIYFAPKILSFALNT